jgi:hypothetical protein
MVYKYQEETIEYLKELSGNLEKLTDDKMTLKIGYARGEFLNSLGTRYYLHSGDLYLRINYGRSFAIINDKAETFDNAFDELYIRFDEDIFLKLNDWIDKIYKNKREREAFHARLNEELKSLNKVVIQ